MDPKRELEIELGLEEGALTDEAYENLINRQEEDEL